MTDAPSVPDSLRSFGGSLHDWLNTSLFTLLALLYIARCEGIGLSEMVLP